MRPVDDARTGPRPAHPAGPSQERPRRRHPGLAQLDDRRNDDRQRPGLKTESTSATFTFSSELADATFECALLTDGDPSFADMYFTAELHRTDERRVHVPGASLDTHGNVDATPAEWEWEIGPMPSPVTITSGPAATTTTTSASFEFTADETLPTFECSLDGGTFAPCASPKTYNGLALGPHNLQVRLLDPAFIAEPPVTTYEWTVQAPTCTATTVTLQADADAWFNSGSTSENKGSDSVLKVMSKSVRTFGPWFASRWGPSPRAASSSREAADVADSLKSGRTLQALQVTGTWTEMGVNWSNQPATTGTAAETASGSNKGWRTWTVTGQVAAMYAAGGGEGFLIRDKVENQDAEQQFFAREKGQNPPQLVITFGP